MGHYFSEMASDAYYQHRDEMYEKELQEFYDALSGVLAAMHASKDKEARRKAMYKFKQIMKKDYYVPIY